MRKFIFIELIERGVKLHPQGKEFGFEHYAPL
jgi:hypothetical protein